jgi:hypothetical protein
MTESAPASEPVLEQASVQTVELVLVAVLGPTPSMRVTARNRVAREPMDVLDAIVRATPADGVNFIPYIKLLG